MPKNPFRAWSPSSNPDGVESLFSPLFAADDSSQLPQAWRPIDYSPAVGSTKAMIEARFANGARSVLKALAPEGPAMLHWQASEDVKHPLYWARESRFLESASSQISTSAFRPVHCHCQVATDKHILMRLEWLEGTPGSKWRESDYEQAAYALGTWQRTIKSLPDVPWVCADWLSGYLSLRKNDLARLSERQTWTRKNLFSQQEQNLVMKCLEHLQACRAQLHRCPHMPAHNDFWPPNLFIVNGQVVAIDWAFVGPSAIGSDIATLMFDSIYDGFLQPSNSQALLMRLKHAYANGAKIEPDASLDVAIHATLTVKYLWFFGHILMSDEAVRQAPLEALQLVLAAARRLEHIKAL